MFGRESLVHFLLMHQDMLERLAHLLHVVELKINSTIHELLRSKTMALSGHGGVRKYKDFEKSF